MPAISVILAAYNAEKYLPEAVDSILGQTFRDFELLLIDDGSKDGTVTIVADYGRRDSRVVPISRPNKGLTPTLNEGIARASAPLLARMDADDVAEPARFEKQVAYFNEHPDCVCLGSRVTLIDPLGSPIKETGHATDHAAIDAGLIKGVGWSIVHPAAMMRADAVAASRRLPRAVQDEPGPRFIPPPRRDRPARQPAGAAVAVPPALRERREHEGRRAMAGQVDHRRRRL